MLRRILILLPLLPLLLSSCEKYKDEAGYCEQCQTRKYCNDPDAVNFNVGFPGIADNSVCVYPGEAFAGNYSYKDSVFTGGTAPIRIDSFVLQVRAIDRVKFSVSGFCSGGEQLLFTANRSLRASGDSTTPKGQTWCRVKDTLSGQITKTPGDSLQLHLSLMVVSDTGSTIHRGTAYRQ